MKQKTNNTTPEHDKSGIYKITCNTYHKSYIRQTKHSLKLRYQEHIRYIKNNNPNSPYAMHILNNRHEYDPTHNTMELLKLINKTKLLIPYEQLYIQSHHHHKQLIPEQNSGECNPMYQLVYEQPTKPPDLHPHPQAQYTSLSITRNLPTATTASNTHQNC
jgi:hypothetical protein